MIELEEAQARIRAELPVLPAETVPLLSANGRILAEDVLAGSHLPPFDNSAMDGYAVRSEDLAGASPESPVHLRLIEEIQAGAISTLELARGQCARVFTGAPLPRGANAVIMQEDTLSSTLGS